MIFENITKKELEDRIIDSIKFLETEYNTYPSCEAWRKALKKILEGNKIKKIEIDNMQRIKAPSTGNFVYTINMPMKIVINKINEIIDKLEEIK